MSRAATVADRTEAPRMSTAEFWDGWVARFAQMECDCPESCAIDHDNA